MGIEKDRKTKSRGENTKARVAKSVSGAISDARTAKRNGEGEPRKIAEGAPTEKAEAAVVNIADLYAARNEIELKKGSKADEQTDEAALISAIAQEEKDASGVADEDLGEYEYVALSEVTSGVGAKLIGLLQEYYMIILVALVIIICLALSSIGQHLRSIFIAVAFGVLVLGGTYILYEAWKDKKAAEKEYRHAKAVIEPVKKKMKEQKTKD